MAKYAEYAKREEEQLEQELQESKQQEQERKNIPESVRSRFDGKSIDDVLEAYANAEKKISEQGNVIGQLRKTSDQLIELQLHGTGPNPVEDEKPDPVTVDDLYENPEEAIGKVVESRTKKQRQEIESDLSELRRTRAEMTLEQKYPGWKTEIQNQDFLDWVSESQYRLRLAQAADAFDLDAANDLLGEWYSRKENASKEREKARRDQAFRDAELETSAPEGFQAEKSFSRSEILEKKVQALQGNRSAKMWLQTHSAAIQNAYREGHLTD